MTDLSLNAVNWLVPTAFFHFYQLWTPTVAPIWNIEPLLEEAGVPALTTALLLGWSTSWASDAMFFNLYNPLGKKIESVIFGIPCTDSQGTYVPGGFQPGSMLFVPGNISLIQYASNGLCINNGSSVFMSLFVYGWI